MLRKFPVSSIYKRGLLGNPDFCLVIFISLRIRKIPGNETHFQGIFQEISSILLDIRSSKLRVYPGISPG
jgi:hypothetical protein